MFDHTTPTSLRQVILSHDGAMGCRDSWSDILLGMSVRLFLEEINM